VIASHYLAAHEAAPDADDAPAVGDEARVALERAGRRARSLAAASEALRYFEQAAALTDGPEQRAGLLDDAGYMAALSGDPDRARSLFEEAIGTYEAVGDTHAAARVMARLARTDAFTGRRDESMARMERAFEVTSGDEPDEDLALLAARLSMGYWYGGDLDRAAARAEFALDIAEAHDYPVALPLALRAKSGLASTRGHLREADALLKQALRLALERDVVEEAAMCYFWLSDRAFTRDAYSEALGYLDEALVLVRKVGDRTSEWAILSERTHPLRMLGRWDEVVAQSDEFTDERWASGGMFLSLFESAAEVLAQRGRLDDARSVVARLPHLDGSSDTQDRSTFLVVRASLNLTEGRARDALTDAEAAIEASMIMGGVSAQSGKHAVEVALEAAHVLGERAKADELLGLIDAIPTGSRPPFLDATLHRFRGRFEADPAEYELAEARFREIGLSFWLAVTLLEHGELVGGESLLAEAREIFDDLRARPWLERLDAKRTAVTSGRTA
jgi:tetratricopeptide (TPR) repeat protein